MEKNLKKVVSKELMLLRKSKDLSNESLANITKLAPSTISRYENGKGSMNLDVISKIVEACNTDIYIFFSNCIAKMQQNSIPY